MTNKGELYEWLVDQVVSGCLRIARFHENDRSETPCGWKCMRGLIKSLFEFLERLADEQVASTGCSCASTQTEAERIANGRFSVSDEDDFGFIGTPEQVIQQMRLFIELGVNTFMLDFNGFPNFSAIELFVRDVLPVLNE